MTCSSESMRTHQEFGLSCSQCLKQPGSSCDSCLWQGYACPCSCPGNTVFVWTYATNNMGREACAWAGRMARMQREDKYTRYAIALSWDYSRRKKTGFMSQAWTDAVYLKLVALQRDVGLLPTNARVVATDLDIEPLMPFNLLFGPASRAHATFMKGDTRLLDPMPYNGGFFTLKIGNMSRALLRTWVVYVQRERAQRRNHTRNQYALARAVKHLRASGLVANRFNHSWVDSCHTRRKVPVACHAIAAKHVLHSTSRFATALGGFLNKQILMAHSREVACTSPHAIRAALVRDILRCNRTRQCPKMKIVARKARLFGSAAMQRKCKTGRTGDGPFHSTISAPCSDVARWAREVPEDRGAAGGWAARQEPTTLPLDITREGPEAVRRLIKLLQRVLDVSSS